MQCKDLALKHRTRPISVVFNLFLPIALCCGPNVRCALHYLKGSRDSPRQLGSGPSTPLPGLSHRCLVVPACLLPGIAEVHLEGRRVTAAALSQASLSQPSHSLMRSLQSIHCEPEFSPMAAGTLANSVTHWNLLQPHFGSTFVSKF